MELSKLHKLLVDCNYLVSTDTRKIIPNSIFFALKGKNFNGNNFANDAIKKGANYVVIDDKIEKKYDENPYIKVDNSLETLQNLAKYNRLQSYAKIIALTGSNGKTTTKELIKSVLEVKYNTISTDGNLNNHIGVPLSLLKIKPETEIALIEMGASNFGEIEFLTNLTHPDIGYITNFGKAHLEGFIDLNGVISAKTELYKWLIKNDKTLLINYDDIEQKKFLNKNSISFGKNENSNYHFENISKNYVGAKYNGINVITNLYGDYNFSNLCAAISIGLNFNIDINEISNKLKNFNLSINRSEYIEKKNKKIILDAYNANPTSMKSAIESFEKVEGNKIVILGDMFELGKYQKQEHEKIIEVCNSKKIDKCIFIGEIFYRLKNNISSNYFYKNKTDFFKNNNQIDETNILIKGSRGMKMEEIFNKIL
jgi:UDP-N-acetylmuramoyl-tripeptide--D-alanyl-D-alanine ligase